MNIHEYQAKALLRHYGVPVPDGRVAFSAGDAGAAAEALGGSAWVVKAQIHAGGRGAGRFVHDPDCKGGVRVVRSPEEVSRHASQMLAATLVTKQTGPAGREVKRVYVEQGCAIARELYLGMLIDRGTARVMIVASTEGGMEIEEVAAREPHKIVKLAIDPATGMQPHHTRRIASALGLSGTQSRAASAFLFSMWRAFIETDASVVEINPLVVTEDGSLLALDAKMNFDDNALFRHPEIASLRDEAEEDPAEREAARHELNYVTLDGNIGCMVNGAGLAMATLDIIKLYGGEPANFLDVGGGATKERVTAAFRLIMRAPTLAAILVNIFGGIMRCDVIAEGVVAAAREVDLRVPLVVRLAGTNVERGKQILRESGLPVLSADHLADAAALAVKAAQGAH